MSNCLLICNSQDILVLTYRFACTLVFFIGILVNYKLFDNVRKEKHIQSSGKVLQWITKTYAMILGIGYPCTWVAWGIFATIQQTHVSALYPCIIMTSGHIWIFLYVLLRVYVGLTSLILAVGRYAFVVHSTRILKFGVDRLGNILIASSFIIPFLITTFGLALISFDLNEWSDKLNVYGRSCFYPKMNTLNGNTTNTFYTSPIYDLVHSYLSLSTTNCMKVLFHCFIFVFYSNVTEGIIYIMSAVFVFR